MNLETNANSNNNASSTPASSSDDSVAVGVRSHSRPQRGKRSDREEGKTASSLEAKPNRREPPKERGPREADPAAEMRAKLRETVSKDLDDDDAMPEHDASGKEDEDEASTEGEAVEAEGEEAPEAEKPVDDAPLKQAQERVQQMEAHVAEVREGATKVLRENFIAAKKLEFYQQALTEALAAAKLELDPRAIKLMEIEAEKEADGQLQGVETSAQKAKHAAEVDKEFKRYTAEVQKAAKQHNIDEKVLARRWAVAVSEWMDAGSKGSEPTVADIVEEMQAISARKQAKASAKAPTLARGATATTTATKRHTNDHDGWKALLKERGFQS